MSLFLFQDGQQTGPFTDEQVSQLLAAGTVKPDAMGWRQGMASWMPLASLRPAGPAMMAPPVMSSPHPYAPPTAKKGSVLGTISFVYGLVSLLGWGAVLLAAGMLQSDDASPSDAASTVVGVLIMGGLALNFIAILFGVAGAVNAQAKTISVLGACVNATILLGLIAILLLTMMFMQGKS